MVEQAELVVRRAVAADLEAVAQLWHESALAMDGHPEVPPRTALLGRIRKELRVDWHLYVALRGQCLVGLLAVKPEEAVLDQIFVLPGEQRLGVGTALLNFAKELMPGGFTLRVATGNGRARSFYEKHGLKVVDEGLHPWTGVPVQFYGWRKP